VLLRELADDVVGVCGGLSEACACPRAGLVVGLGGDVGQCRRDRAVLYFAGAVATHIRAKDPKFQPPAALMLLSIAALVLRIVTR
jgi:hypothetical protein